MTAELVNNPWGVLLFHPDDDVLELRWLPTTATMTDGGFMATLCLFAWQAEKTRPRRLLIDAVEFRHQFGNGITEWRNAHIIPRYGAAGVRKLAFVMPPGFPDTGKEAVEGPAVFPTNWFVNRSEALNWLRTD